MTEEELDRMRLVAREALSKQAEREARQRKMVAEMCRDNEFWNERPSFVHTQFSIHDALDRKKQAYKQAQRAINCLLSELAAKTTCAPKEKTYSQAYMDRMQKANQSLGEEIGHLTLENIKMQRCLEASGEILENTTDELKESQAENELLRATVQSLLNGKDNTDEACEAPEADRERELI